MCFTSSPMHGHPLATHEHEARSQGSAWIAFPLPPTLHTMGCRLLACCAPLRADAPVQAADVEVSTSQSPTPHPTELPHAADASPAPVLLPASDLRRHTIGSSYDRASSPGPRRDGQSPPALERMHTSPDSGTRHWERRRITRTNSSPGLAQHSEQRLRSAEQRLEQRERKRDMRASIREIRMDPLVMQSPAQSFKLKVATVVVRSTALGRRGPAEGSVLPPKALRDAGAQDLLESLRTMATLGARAPQLDAFIRAQQQEEDAEDGGDSDGDGGGGGSGGGGGGAARWARESISSTTTEDYFSAEEFGDDATNDGGDVPRSEESASLSRKRLKRRCAPLDAAATTTPSCSSTPAPSAASPPITPVAADASAASHPPAGGHTQTPHTAPAPSSPRSVSSSSPAGHAEPATSANDAGLPSATDAAQHTSPLSARGRDWTGAAELSGGAAELSGGAAELSGGAAELSGGAAELSGGAAELSRGPARSPRKSSVSAATMAAFVGAWRNTLTTNLEPYLKSIGVGWAKRKVALAFRPELSIAINADSVLQVRRVAAGRGESAPMRLCACGAASCTCARASRRALARAANTRCVYTRRVAARAHAQQRGCARGASPYACAQSRSLGPQDHICVALPGLRC